MSSGASSHKLVTIEVGRGIAASMVVLYHVARHLDKVFGAPLLMGIFQFGHAGVDFFFVLSGFIILFVHYDDVDDADRIVRYIERRSTRLLPTYWIALAAAVAMAFAGHHGAPSVADLVWSASLLPSNHRLVLDVAWTLRFEVLFYLLFGILILKRTAGLALLAVWLSVILLALVTSFHPSWMPGEFYGAYALEFFFGMVAAYLLRNHNIPHSRLVLAMGILLFGIAALLEDIRFLDGYSNIARLAYGIPAVIIVLGLVETERQSFLRVPSVLRKLGSASYSIYLFQFIFIGTIWQALLVTGLYQRIPLAAEFFVLVLPAIIGGIVVSRYIEYPLMRLLRSRSRARRVRPILG